ncbi:MAG TPA: glycoside hydrolase family 38 C-terminal domain-containing protein [Opitutaceae bacterium]
MFPATFLTQLIPARIAEALRRVEKRIWTRLPAEIAVSQTASFQAFRRPEELSPAEFSPVPAAPFHWGPKYAQRWFRLSLPEWDDRQTRYLVWNDQAEATAYVGGVPYSGLDLAHRYCPLPAGLRELWIEAVCIRSAIWLDGTASHLTEDGSRYLPPEMAVRDDLAWSVYHDLKVLLDLLEAEHRDYHPGATKPFTDPVRHTPPALRVSPLFRRLCDRLDRAVGVFDREGLPAFAAALRAIYRDFPAEAGALEAVLTGHAHIDLVWLWPERVGEFKAVHSWATQVRLLQTYPEFRFGYSQPASYEAVARRAPRLHDRVRGLIAEGRWEATGASYVESDTQLPCGEALWRSLRLGQEAFAELRGRPATVFWLPDVFGYTGCLPQLLRACGVTGFFTTKLSWSTLNRHPHTSFVWRGNDGSEVVAHVVLLHDYNEAVDIRRLREDALHHQQAAVHHEFLVPTGYGDGGGGPTEEMCERTRRVNDLAGVPRTQWGGIEAFYERLARVQDRLPVAAGELMLELHRGVYTTHGCVKSAFRGLERALQIQEAAHAVTGAGPIDQAAWRRLVFAQFHDYIPGSSIWEVYAEGVPELERLAASALQTAQAQLSAPGAAPAATGWFNPLAVGRTWIDGEACYWLGPLSGGPAAGLKRVAAKTPDATAESLASDRVRARFGRDGGLLALSIDGRRVALTGAGHALCAYPDHPAAFEAWDVDRNTLVDGLPATPTGEPEIRQEGLEASVAFTYRIGNDSTVRVCYRVVATEPVLRIDYDVDWRDPECLLKAIFTTSYRGRQARFGAPFGSTLRGQWPGHVREEALWEVPFSRWLAVTDDAQAEGLAVVTRDRYGASVRDGAAGITLLRSAWVTEADHHPAIRETPDRPMHSDLGRQHISLALGRFAGDLPLEEQPAVLADTLYTPCVPAAGETAWLAGLGGIQDSTTLVPCWTEPAANGAWSLRLHEVGGRGGVARIALQPGWIAAAGALQATPADVAAGAWHEGVLPVEFGPYAVVTVWFRRA